MLLRIVSSFFVAGVVVGERAAPIVKYLAGKSEAEIRAYCARRGWAVDEVPGE